MCSASTTEFGPASPSCTAGSASGKVILLGEHAVVYGAPAIAVGIDRGARAEARPIDETASRLTIAQWDIDLRADDPNHELARAFRGLLVASSVTATLHVALDTDLSPGAGLGCSAALGVAVARAVDPHADASTIAARVSVWENVFHGNASGIDAAVAAHGGSILFKKGTAPTRVPLAQRLLLCVGDTGVSSSTKQMVDSVRRLRERRPDVVGKTFEGIASVVNNARLAIEGGDITALGKLMDLNQMLLSGLFLSTEEIETMCSVSRANGALGAKLTGAGGGGSVIALCRDEGTADAVLAAWRKERFTGFTAQVLP